MDREIVNHFDSSYMMGSFADPDVGNIVIWGSTMADVPRVLEWANRNPE